VSSRPAVLERIVSETRAELVQRKRGVPLGALQAQVAPDGTLRLDGAPGRFHEALARPGIGVIAEFKRRSPSAGRLRENADVQAIAGAYERGGASALSVLTEGPNFEGSLADLGAARAVCGLPILRKDFIVDPYQLHEARIAGADAVLLIVAALDQDELASLHELAVTLGLDVLVEVHDRRELERAARIGARLIGVNNRDLRDFTVDVQRTSRLLGDMPAGAIVVSESGIAAPEQLRELERQGVSAVLVGESLMRASDPQGALAALLEVSSVEGSLTRVCGNASGEVSATGVSATAPDPGSNLL
jgi:indole-3-glycerol phosphate synthase